MRWLLWLYPADWRERYVKEMTALLGEQHVSLLDALDLLLGAFDAWLHPMGSERQVGGRHNMPVAPGRLAGLSLIVGAVIWTLFVAGVQAGHGWISVTPPLNDAGRQLVLFLLSSLAFILALLGLTGMWLHVRERGRGSRLGEIGLAVMLLGCLLFVASYAVFIAQGFDTGGGAYTGMMLGLILFVMSAALQGLASVMSRILPVWSTAPLVVSPVLMSVLPLLLTMHREDTPVQARAYAREGAVRRRARASLGCWL